MVDPQTGPPVLLVLGGSTDQIFMIRTARRMGLRTACLDGNPAAPGLQAADLGAAIDFSDLDAVFAWIDERRRAGENLAGVSTMGSDVPHLLAAISARYGWPGPTAETGRLATDKLAMKERFAERSVPVPRFAAVAAAADARDRWRAWECSRVIVKPTDRAGSRGVQVLSDESALPSAVETARRESRTGGVILEEFVDGPQISTETVVLQGRAVTPGFADRLYEGMEVFHPQIMENGGWLPSQFAGTPVQGQVERLVESAAAALGIATGVAKGDVVVCPRRGPMMIEMAARLSGGDFSAGLVPLGTGVNYVEAVIALALGREPDRDRLQPSRRLVVANRYFFPPPGRLDEVDVPADFSARPGLAKLEITRRPGDVLPRIASHGDRAGVMVLTGGSRAEVQELIDEGYRRVRFRVDGSWRSGLPE
ncbi:MAG: ATP-grasp domain-containing protein [Candidatus Krumholzibacteriia bacterium]